MKKIYLCFLFVVISMFSVDAQQYSQSFDAATMPSDWTVINGGDANTWKTWASYSTLSTINPHSGARYLGLEYGSSAHDDYAISPAIQVVAGVSDKLSFWSVNGGSGLAEKISVKISTTTPTAAAFTTSLVTNLTPPTTWTQYTYDLTPYVGQTIYIAFYSNTTDIWFIGIDDFAISGTLSVSEVNDKPVSKLYPNPIEDYLFIEGKEKISDIKIVDYSGKIVLTPETGKENNQIKINVANLKNGNYIINFLENGISKSRKIMKK